MTARKIAPITQDRVIDRKITVTLFPDEFAKTKSEKTIRFSNLAEAMGKRTAKTKDALPYIKLATFGDQKTNHDCLRSNANMLWGSGIEVEHDAGDVSFEEAEQRLRSARLAAVLCTTASEGAEPGQRERISNT